MTTGHVIAPAGTPLPARWGLVVLALLVAVWALAACGGGRAGDDLHIRIHNATGRDISKFWLGAGSGAGGPGSQAYGAIADGETTRYRGLKAQFGSYSNFNFITQDGERFIGSTVANDLIGEFTLEPGYYTFELTLVDGAAAVTINQDATP